MDFWSRESPVAPESGVFDDAKRSFSAYCSSAMRRQIDMGIGRHTHPGARRSVEHPGRNLKPTVRI
jgi:hypothetical protein